MSRFGRIQLLRLRIAAALLLLVVLAACQDATLKKIAQAELDVEQTQATAIKSLDTLYSAGSITAADVQTVGGILKQINVANGQAIAITKNLAQLDPASRSNLRDIIVPLLNAVNAGLTNGVINIKDPTARASISASLSAIAVSLTIIQQQLGG